MCGLKAARGTEAFMSTYAQNQGSCTTGAITLLMTRRESAPRAAETLAPPGPPPARGGLRVPTGLTAGRDCESRILSYILFFRTEVRVTGCRRQGRRLAMRDRMAQPQKPLPRPSTQGGGIVVSCGELRNSSAARAVAQLMRHVSSGTQLAKGDSGGAQAPLAPRLSRWRAELVR